MGFSVSSLVRNCFASGVKCFSARKATVWCPLHPQAFARGTAKPQQIANPHTAMSARFIGKLLRKFAGKFRSNPSWLVVTRAEPAYPPRSAKQPRTNLRSGNTPDATGLSGAQPAPHGPPRFRVIANHAQRS